MGHNTRYDPEVMRREALKDERDRKDAILRAGLKDSLLTALRTGPDAVYAVQRACGHDLVRLGLLAEDLRVVSSGGEIVEVNVPDNVVDPHEADNLALLQIIHKRLTEDSSIVQAERLELVRLMTLISRCLGQMIGR